MTLMLIDLSSLAYPIWHMSQSDPDPNATSVKTLARVRALSEGQPHVAVCCDSGRTFRHDLSPTYKANRGEKLGTLMHQIGLIQDALMADGFPVWSAPGFEADDIIASAATAALKDEGAEVLVASADKDLLQLVGPRCRVKSLTSGDVLDEAAVFGKVGVTPQQMRDYLTLMGDASDNVAGAKGIGQKRAAELLNNFGTLDAVYAVLDETKGDGLPPSVVKSLTEFREAMPLSRALITLRTDVPLDLSAWLTERITPVPPMDDQPTFDMTPAPEVLEAEHLAQPPTETPAPPSTALAVLDAAPAPADWQLQLDPRSMADARTLAKDLHASRLLSAYGTPQGVLSTIMLGRELGLPAMASLRGVHIIEGKHALSAATMVGLVLKSGLAEYFEPVTMTGTEATFATKRKGARREVTLTHTLEDAKTAGLVKPGSGWAKNPADMLVARAQARLARLVYPDLLAGLYSPEEQEDMRDTKRSF